MLLACWLLPTVRAALFTSGSIVVLRVGINSYHEINAAPVFIDEYAADGFGLLQSIPLVCVVVVVVVTLVSV
jgi:hypothetical protein